MRSVVVRLVSLFAACVLLGVSADTAFGTAAVGGLAGLTQITFGCPGPQRVGEKCEHWSAFARARFALSRTRGDGTPIPESRRVITSDRTGSFSISVTAGVYTVKPLAQPHTKGGPLLRVRVLSGRVTRVTVRFLGFPMMV